MGMAACGGRGFAPRFATGYFTRRHAARGETVTRETDADSDILRGKVKNAIERNLAEKGLKKASDPESADFLVDFISLCAAAT